MRLAELTALPSSADPEVTGVTEDSRRVAPGMVFVAKRLFLDYLSPTALLAYDADSRAARTLASEAHVDRTAAFSLVSVIAPEGLPSEGGSYRIEEGRGRVGGIGKRVTRLTLEHLRLGADGARFTIEGEAMHSTLMGRGHLRNVALAATYALASGVPSSAVREVLGRLAPLRRRMERYHAAVYAIRGSRGVDINRRTPGDLMLLLGAQGMDRGRELVNSGRSSSGTTSTPQ